jgi:integrase
MISKNEPLDVLISRYYREDLVKDRRISERSKRSYRDGAVCAFKIINEFNAAADPTNIKVKDVHKMLDTMTADGYAVATRKNYATCLSRICGFYKNYSVQEAKIVWPQDVRPNVDWLTIEQAKALMDFPKTPNQELLVMCELGMGLRRVEVSRMCMSHMHNGYMDVIGKGKAGGKLRTVPFHPRMYDTLNRYYSYRCELEATAKSVNRYPVVVPDRMLIYRKKGKLFAYSDVKLTGVDKLLSSLSDEIGIEFTHHTLRRTFGRTMFHSHVPVATIAKLLGHESTDMTLKYIGVDLDDMSAAMTNYMLR